MKISQSFQYTITLLAVGLTVSSAFVSNVVVSKRTGSTRVASTVTAEEELTIQKQKLLELLGAEPKEDPILVDPITKEPITIESSSTLLGGNPGARVSFELKSPNNTFAGSSDSFLNLLEPVKNKKEESSSEDVSNSLARNLMPFVPPPLRSILTTAGLTDDEYVPMRDLFTSPAVSYAYERGWRQGFAAAGFPGAEKEAAMAMEYFEPSMSRNYTRVLVDMSCATGLFTRPFAASGKYKRVLGCDYSDSMLIEARRRIQADSELRNLRTTQLDLVRLDVGQIPMRSDSIDALHAGAAMHCWPDLPAAASEVYRVLKPGGRYFATTFLSSYFGSLRQAQGGANGPSQQAFQYFGSVDQLRQLMIDGGFAPENVLIEVLGEACVVIRCEK